MMKVKIVKEVKGVMACDVLPVAMFFVKFDCESKYRYNYL